METLMFAVGALSMVLLAVASLAVFSTVMVLKLKPLELGKLMAIASITLFQMNALKRWWLFFARPPNQLNLTIKVMKKQLPAFK